MNKKISKRIVSFLLAMVMIFTMTPTGFIVSAGEIEECLYDITKFGLEPDDNNVVKNGTTFEVGLRGRISADYTDTTLPLTFYINNLDIENVMLSGGGKIRDGISEAGSFTVESDGTICITIDDTPAGQKFIQGGDREFEIFFSATVDVEDTDNGNEVPATIKIDGQVLDVTVQFPDSKLEGEKRAVGDAWYDPDTGEIYQTYVVRLTARGADVTGVEISDFMGEWLSVSEYDDWCYGTITYGDGETDEFYLPDKIDSHDPSKFFMDGIEIRKDETIEIEYTLAIDMDYFNGFGEKDGRALNECVVDFEDQNGNPHEKELVLTAYPYVERPKVTKSGTFTTNGDEVVWTITVDAGILKSLADYGYDFFDYLDITVTDKPGEGLADEGDAIVLDGNEFVDNGNGTYTFTYVTKLTDEVITKLKDISEDVKVYNEVEVGNEDFTISTEGTATRLGMFIIEKEATADEADADGRFAWSSTLTVPAEGIRDLVFTDSTVTSANGHTILKDTMEIDGTPIAELEAAGKVTVTVSGKELRVAFSGAYLAELQNKNRREYTPKGGEDKLYVADIVITYMTVPDKASDLQDSYVFTNVSDLEYTATETGAKVKDSASDYYEKTISAQRFFTKACPTSWGSTGTADWEIKFEASLVELAVGDVFEIMDTPENMVILEHSITPVVFLYGYYGPGSYATDLSEIYADVDSCLAFRDNNNGTYTFTFTVTRELYDAVNAEAWSPSEVFLAIRYSTAITNPGENEWGLDYVNTATGTFNGRPSEETSATTTIYPGRSLQKGSYYGADNDNLPYGGLNGKVNIQYTVDINPDYAMFGKGEYIKLIDKMNENLIMIPGSIVLKDTLSGITLENGVDYFIDFDIDKNEMYLTVPNGRSMTLTYMAGLNGEVGEELQVINTVGMEAEDFSFELNPTKSSVEVLQGLGFVSSEGRSVVIAKRSTINDTKVFPEGAEFEVVRVTYDPDKNTFDPITGNMESDGIKISYDKNLARIEGLVTGAIYRLTETKAPEGYVLSQDPVYFVISGDEGTEIPQGVLTFGNGDTYYFDNAPEFGTLQITKTVDAEGITDAELKGALKFTVQNAAGKYLDEKGGLHDDKIEISLDKFKRHNDGTYALTFLQLPVGEYKVTETNAKIKGYDLISSASVTTGKATVTSGNTADVKLKDCYTRVSGTTSFTVEKHWNDAGHEDFRPDKVTVHVVITLTDTEGNEKEKVFDEDVDLLESNGWKWTSEGYDTYADQTDLNSKVKYRIKVTEPSRYCPPGYVLEMVETDYNTNIVKVWNKYKNESDFSFEVKKDWKGQQPPAGATVTAKVTITNRVNNAKVHEEVITLADGGSWSWNTKLKLPQCTLKSPGVAEEITYAMTVEEVSVKVGDDEIIGNYDVTYSAKEAAVGFKTTSASITIFNAPKFFDLTGTKTWVDDDDELGLRPEPEDFKVVLYADGVKQDDVPEWSYNGNVWTYVFQNLPGKRGDNTYVKYTVEEDFTSPYYNGRSEDNDFTNTLKRKDVFVDKTDIANSKEVVGAKLKITTTIQDENGDAKEILVKEWESGSEPEKIEGLVPGLEYVLHEESAPDGYVKISSAVTFTVDEDGNVKVTSESVWDETTKTGDAKEDGSTLIVNDSKKSENNAGGNNGGASGGSGNSNTPGNPNGNVASGNDNKNETLAAPKTGDATDHVLWLVFLALSFASICTGLRARRAKRSCHRAL